MFKKSLIFLLALTANVLAIANPTIKIGSYVDTLSVNYSKFAEPTVSVYDGSNNVTKQYSITYGFEDFTEETDSRGVRIVKDNNTGATVEKYYGGVTTGLAGNVTVKIYATNKETHEILEGEYSFVVKSNAVGLTFAPQFGQSTNGHDGSITMNVLRISNKNANNALYYVPSTSCILPVYTLTTTTLAGKTTDVSEYYDVNISYSGSDKITLNNDVISYKGVGDQNNINYTEQNISDEITALNNTPSTITYTFTPKAGYAGIYETITKVIDVNVNIDLSGVKQKVHLSLPRELFEEENVTGTEEDGYTIHVYKFGQSNVNSDHYQYWTPNPAILTKDGSQLRRLIGKKEGQWNDFKLFYKIVSDEAYYDSCWHSNEAAIHAGDPTGTEVNATYFQVNHPGLVKVAVYAALPEYSWQVYGQSLRDTYEPLMENGQPVQFTASNSQDHDTYTMYSEPVYFYIDIMKRVADLKFTPDPSTIVFAKGDKVYIPERFSVYGEIDDNSNGYAAGMIWDPYNSGEQWIDGKKYELFDYSFFISDRMNDHYIRLNNWPATAGRDREDWVEATEMSIGTDVTVGDKILVDGQYILLDSTNIADYAGRKLQEGDLEHGRTYLAMRYWGNEEWTIEFLETGRYSIPYTIRPWNHQCWDDGGNNNQWTFQVVGTIDTKIDLSYTFQTAPKGLVDFDEPIAKVIAPVMNNYDVTEKFNLYYYLANTTSATSSTSSSNTTNTEYSYDNDNNISYKTEYITTSSNYFNGDSKIVEEILNTKVVTGSQNGKVVSKTTTILSGTQKDMLTNTTINVVGGDVIIGDAIGDVRIRVHAERKSVYQTVDEVYENPADTFYTIRIIDPKDNATWEIISECKSNGCTINEHRFHDASKENGRFHFLTTGNLYGGTIITGVPGISMTIGAPAADIADAAEWSVASLSVAHPKCCMHEEGNGVVSKCSSLVTLDSNNIPTAGGFYKFSPIVNGYLTVDAKFNANDKIVLISKQSGDIIEEDTTFTSETVGDITFKKALLAGETYYLYNLTNNDANDLGIALHGFAYQPAYIIDRNSTLAESVAEFEATTFMNGLSNSLPTITNTAHSTVSFERLNGIYQLAEPSEYLDIATDGTINPKQMTLAGDDIFYLIVKATVKSTDANLGNCVDKTSQYKIKIVDIPTYAVTDNFDYLPGDEVSTENIMTDIVMTYGGWQRTYNTDKTDEWKYKSIEGAATRIGGGDEDPTILNKTIDGFELFAAGNNNPVDELNQSALHNGQYIYRSGVIFENDEYNTTYDLPCRGNFLKFEPRESGTVLVYLVQNGCCSYHAGITKIEKEYQLKWLPLYITDETGKPATMVNDFGAMSKFLPTGKDKTNAGSYTLGISRCNKVESAVADAWDHSSAETYGTSFDWSNFHGTTEDREMLLNAWTAKGERESIIRLEDGGFVLPHKAYVRYAFQVKAGKTYFVFQPGSKFEFGGFSFVPTGYPNNCKYNLNGTFNEVNMEKNYDGKAGNIASKSFTWKDASNKLDNIYTEKENLFIDVNDRVNSLQMKERKFYEGEWAGICLPFSVSNNELKRVYGDDFQLITVNDYTNDTVYVTQHANKYVEAGRPYFILPSQSGTMHFENVSIEGKTLVKTNVGSEDDYTPIIDPTRFERNLGDSYTLKGIYTGEDLPAYSCFASRDGFYHFGFNTTIGGYRAYLRAVNNQSNAKAINFSFRNMYEDDANEEITTGILLVDESNNMSMIEGNTAIYNINGQMVGKGASAINSVQHGVYIMNGKKYIK